MKKDDYFYQHASKDVEAIREFRKQSPLGYFNSPEEYMDVLGDYIKLFYEINNVPDDIVDKFNNAIFSFQKFKCSIECVCESLDERIKEINDDNDTTKNQEAS